MVTNMYLITPTDVYVCTKHFSFLQCKWETQTSTGCFWNNPEVFADQSRTIQTVPLLQLIVAPQIHFSTTEISRTKPFYTLTQLPFQIKKQVWFLSHSIRQRSQIRSEGSPALRTKSRKRTTALSTAKTKVGEKNVLETVSKADKHRQSQWQETAFKRRWGGGRIKQYLWCVRGETVKLSTDLWHSLIVYFRTRRRLKSFTTRESTLSCNV